MFKLLVWVGAVPALIAMYLVDRADAKRPEPRSTLRRVALAGALSVIPAGVLELYLLKLGPQHGLQAALYLAFVVAAPIEEISKGLCVRWFVWNRPEFDERTDGIVYGTRAGLGFALLENVGYLLLAKSMLGFTWMFLVRAFLTVPMHAITGGLLGHYAAWKRFEGRGPGILGGLLLAIALHGTFDAGLLVSATLIQEKDYGVALVASLYSLAVVIGGLLALRRAWRTALSADDRAQVGGGTTPGPVPTRESASALPDTRPATQNTGKAARVAVLLGVATFVVFTGGLVLHVAQRERSTLGGSCKPNDFADCTAQCERRDALSCYNLGVLYANGKGVNKDEARAAALYKQGCDGGQAISCNNLGAMYANGKGVNKDETRAAALYQQSCDPGFAAACYNLGVMYANGNGVNKDEGRAAALYKQSCDRGDATACSNLGLMYRYGTGVNKDEARAVALYELSCTGNYALGCSNLGTMYGSGTGVNKDEARAAALYKKGCDGGEAIGCFNLGLMYENGTGVNKDEARAAALYTQGCDGGQAISCSSLGTMYENGTGVNKDEARAAALYKQGCDGGNGLGCYNLGVMYTNGTGVNKDEAQAVAFYKQGCDGGQAKSCNNLGVMYLNGTGVNKDVDRAVALYEQSCNGGGGAGCSNLGALYERGRGVPADRAKAIGLYQHGCEVDSRLACEQLKRAGGSQ